MKILHLRTSNFYGGPERQLHFHAKEATDSGCEIIIGSFLEDGQSPEFINVISDDNILTQTFNVSGGYDLKAIKLVREFLIDKNISILCTHDYRSHLIGMMARRKTLAKWIAFSRGWTSEDIKIKFYHMLDKIFIRYANHVVAVSESQKLRLTKLLVSKNKITTVHNAIDPKAFAHVEAVDLRDKFDLPQNSIIGISGGRFSAEKGQKYFVRAAKIAHQQDNNLYFILFGDGPDRNIIQQEINNENLSDFIICPGFEKNLIGCLKGADFLVNPSLSEGLPNIILEAMAMGVPSVATDVGGVGEIIKDGFNGLLVPSKSPKQLADAIIRIVNDKEKASKYIENAHKTIGDNFSFDSQFNSIKNIYEYLVK